mmetsp:Transcript_40153/g.115391  ORF Transcript_40153/g.115391 Transcript_40153/m.115391 type:complete len:253 (+) Transcript_40153:2194-2952(+)
MAWRHAARVGRAVERSSGRGSSRMPRVGAQEQWGFGGCAASHRVRAAQHRRLHLGPDRNVEWGAGARHLPVARDAPGQARDHRSMLRAVGVAQAPSARADLGDRLGGASRGAGRSHSGRGDAESHKAVPCHGERTGAGAGLHRAGVDRPAGLLRQTHQQARAQNILEDVGEMCGRRPLHRPARVLCRQTWRHRAMGPRRIRRLRGLFVCMVAARGVRALVVEPRQWGLVSMGVRLDRTGGQGAQRTGHRREV